MSKSHSNPINRRLFPGSGPALAHPGSGPAPGSGTAPAGRPADHDSRAEEVIRPGGGPMFNQSQLRWLAVWLLRVALAFSFLSAVADRFGLWGPFGVAGVGWGDFERFTAYTARLLWFLPPSLVSPAAILATGAEVIVAGGPPVGWGAPGGGLAAGRSGEGGGGGEGG